MPAPRPGTDSERSARLRSLVVFFILALQSGVALLLCHGLLDFAHGAQSSYLSRVAFIVLVAATGGALIATVALVTWATNHLRDPDWAPTDARPFLLPFVVGQFAWPVLFVLMDPVWALGIVLFGFACLFAVWCALILMRIVRSEARGEDT